MDNIIEEIKSKIDIVDFISEYLRLKPAGTSFKALCPFHKEKTPSFFVSPERQIWHCFGCGAGGDIFTFLMKIEGIDFPEALRILAKRAGVKLKPTDSRAVSQRTKLLDILKSSAEFYHQLLKKDASAKQALDYLKGRGVEDKSIDEFQLGWSPESGRGLLDFLIKKGYKEKDIEQAGLIIKRQSSPGYFDRFRARIIFPINDLYGNVVGFGGRILKEEEDKPKYINTPETPVYNKSRLLYGLDKAKQYIRKSNYAVLVEGYMDVIASHQAGIKNVIASSGTALTLEQIKLLKRYSPNLILSFDVDLAGQEATRRGIELCFQEEMNLKIITELKGKDPDECIREDVELWKKAIRNSQPIMEYYFNSAFSLADPSQLSGKKKIVSILLPVISKFGNKVEQDYWLKTLAQKLDISEEAIREELKKIELKKDKGSFAEEENVFKQENKTRLMILAERFLAFLLKFSSDFPQLLENYYSSFDFKKLPGGEIGEIARELNIYYNKKHQKKGFQFDFTDFRKGLKDKKLKDYADFLMLLADKEFSLFEKEEELVAEFKKLEKQLKKESLSSQIKDLEKELKEAEKEGQEEKIEEITQKLNKVVQELAKIV